MMKGLLTFLIGGIAVAAVSNIAKSKAELDEYEEKMASGGEVGKVTNAPKGMIFVKSTSHRASEKIRKEKIPYITLYSFSGSRSASTTVMLMKKVDFEKIKSIKGVHSSQKLIGVWNSRKESDSIHKSFREVNEMASGGTIGQYEVIGSLRFIEAATPDNEVRVSTNVIADSKEDAIKKVKRMYGLDVAPDSDLYAELVESYE
jgi:hypothetical protein